MSHLLKTRHSNVTRTGAPSAQAPFMSEEAPVHKRRKRYPGRNPRRFEDRYKEHNPEKYPEAAAHIEAKGNTLAGTHRPICVEEILTILDPKPGEMALDATLGYGGHAREILPRLAPEGRLFGIDADPIELPKTEARLRALGHDEESFVARQLNFSGVRSLIYEAGGGFDCILADLGVSSMQLDNPTRGFTHKSEGPLDLRLNPRKGKSAAEFLQTLSLEELESCFVENADEPHALWIARAIKEQSSNLTTTVRLADTIKARLKKMKPPLSEKDIKKSVQRCFMALRISVNEEFDVLDRFLKVLPHCLNPGGRVAILTFHSGEDRRVKKAFAKDRDLGLYSEVASKPKRPSAQECRDNPRSSCAKLRWAVRTSS